MVKEPPGRGPPSTNGKGGGDLTATTTPTPSHRQAAGNANPIAPKLGNRYRSKRARFRIACLDRLCIFCTCGRSSADEHGRQ
jgi:hypothetical protein